MLSALIFVLKTDLEVLEISKQEHQINEEIRDREVRVIDQNGEQLGVQICLSQLVVCVLCRKGEVFGGNALYHTVGSQPYHKAFDSLFVRFARWIDP